jgi:hypothetical protein
VIVKIHHGNPTRKHWRHLGKDPALHHMAERACTGIEEASKDFGVFDVTAAGTEEGASTY